MKTTTRFIAVWLAVFFALLLVGGGYELLTLMDGVDNNTISHATIAFTERHEWVKPAFVVFTGAWFVFWVSCACHWWGRGFWWGKPVFEDEDEDDE